MQHCDTTIKTLGDVKFWAAGSHEYGNAVATIVF